MTDVSDLALIRLHFTGRVFETLDQLEMSSLETAAELYVNYETYGLQLENSLFENPSLTLVQNVPNPWNNTTELKFFTDKDDQLSINVFDVTGKRLISQQDFYSAGWHSITFDAIQFPARGIYYIELSNKETTLRNKMILVK